MLVIYLLLSYRLADERTRLFGLNYLIDTFNVQGCLVDGFRPASLKCLYWVVSGWTKGCRFCSLWGCELVVYHRLIQYYNGVIIILILWEQPNCKINDLMSLLSYAATWVAVAFAALAIIQSDSLLWVVATT